MRELENVRDNVLQIFDVTVGYNLCTKDYCRLIPVKKSK